MDLEKVLEQHKKWLNGESGGIRADLYRANLSKADLRGASLSKANLRKADLYRANLSKADLRKVNLRKADLSKADLREANLREADLRKADLSGADLSGTVLPEGIPAIPNIDAAILAAIEAGGRLDMRAWHTCSTTHCRAGWAIYLAGEAGYELEQKLGPSVAAALIYAASGSYPVPDWYASDDEAMSDLRDRANT